MLQNCNEFLNSNEKLKYFVTLEFHNENAETFFFKLLPKIKRYPSLVYLDQNGVKFISKQFIEELEKLNTVDFIYFVSSSYFWRLGSTDEFRKVLQFDMEELKKDKYQNIHRKVISEIKKYLPQKSNLKLFPFSLKKRKNVYGIIFGAKHFLAVDKFLDVAWKRNATNGEADFDIDGDSNKIQMDIFSGQRMTKIEKFKNELEGLILNGTLVSNSDVLVYTYESGHIPLHSKEVIKELKNQGKIFYEGKTSGVNYDNVFKKKNIVNYKLK